MIARWAPLLCLSTLFLPSLVADAAEPAELNERAAESLRSGDYRQAVALAAESLQADDEQTQPHFIRARAYSALGQHAEAIGECDRLLAIDPASIAALELRGDEHFRRGEFEKSVADFDRAIELEPRLGREHWKRGISCRPGRASVARWST